MSQRFLILGRCSSFNLSYCHPHSFKWKPVIFCCYRFEQIEMGEGKQISRLENPQPSDARQKYIYIFFYFYFLFNVFVFLNFKFLNRISLFFFGRGGGISSFNKKKRQLLGNNNHFKRFILVNVYCRDILFSVIFYATGIDSPDDSLCPKPHSVTFIHNFRFFFFICFSFFQGGYLLLLLSLVLFQHLCSCYFSKNFKFEVLIFFFLLLLSVSIPLLSLSIFSLHL